MTVLIRAHRAYEQVLYDREHDFTLIVKTVLAKVLPKFSIINFSPYVVGDEGIRRKPDLALVHHGCRMWAVVEVELETHSLRNHVIPQVRTFATGRYDKSHAKLLCRNEPRFQIESLCNLIEYVPPAIVVVVNSCSVLETGWGMLESELSAHLTFVESFRSADEDVIFSISGYLPELQPLEVMKFRKNDMLNALVCKRPWVVPAAVTEEMEMYVDERPYVWQVLRTKDSIMFLPPVGFTVRSDRNYEIRQADDGKFRLHEL